MSRATIFLAGCLIGDLCLVGNLNGDVTIEVASGKHERRDTPISVDLPPSMRGARQRLSLRRMSDDREVRVQVLPGKEPRLIWLPLDPIPAGATRRYRLSTTEQTLPVTATDGVVVSDNDGRIKIRVGGKTVLVYNSQVVRAANREEEYYDRSGYIHPLYSPAGDVITDDFAPDHPHQHGIMFPWTNTVFEGRSINFWEQQNGNGRVEHESIGSLLSGEVVGGFAVRLKHLDISSPDKPQAVLGETWRVHVYNMLDHFLCDFESEQLATSSPLQVEKYHYGGFAIRGRRDWLIPGQGGFLTSEGKTRENGNHSRPQWVDLHGRIGNSTSGVTIFCHPENFRAPQPVRLHPSKPYFCFAPMVTGAFKIESGQPYQSRYRLLVHHGPLDTKQADRIWRDLAEPPTIKIVP